MIFELGGISGVIAYDTALRPTEHALLSAFSRKVTCRAFGLRIIDGKEGVANAGGAPSIRWEGRRALVTGTRFEATIDLEMRRVELARDGERDDSGPLQQALRAATAIFLPGEGWLPLQAAAIEIDGQLVLFVGPPGGGKSSLAAMSPYPVAGDEMIAVDPVRGIARPTVFWGDTGYRPVDSGSDARTVRAIVLLNKGERFAFEWLNRDRAAEVLAESVHTPSGEPVAPQLQTLTAAALQKFRFGVMTWDRFLSPWEQLVPQLKR